MGFEKKAFSKNTVCVSVEFFCDGELNSEMVLIRLAKSFEVFLDLVFESEFLVSFSLQFEC